VTVSAQTPINRSTGNGVTTVFPYSFKVLSAGDMQVTVGGVVKALTTDYTLSGVGTDSGNVTMLAAPASGAVVVLQRNMAYTRGIDFQDQGSLPAATLDGDQDAPVMMIQQMAVDVTRSIRYPLQDAAMTDLPAAAVRANLLLGFDALGNPVATSPMADSSTGLRAALSASSGASLLGFTPEGAGSQSTDAQSKLRERVSVFDKMTAAQKTDAVTRAFTLDLTAACQAAADSLTNGGELIVPAGTYMIDPCVNPTSDTFGGIKLLSNTTLILEAGAILKAKAVTQSFSCVVQAFNKINVTIKGVGSIEGEKSRHLGAGGEHGMGVFIAGSTNVDVLSLKIRDCCTSSPALPGPTARPHGSRARMCRTVRMAGA